MLSAFQQLPTPTEKNRFTVDPTLGWCRVGRSYEGHPVLLLNFTKESAVAQRHSLKLLEYRPPTVVEVIGGTESTLRVAILECRTTDQQLVEYFFRIVQTLILDDPANQHEDRFKQALERLIALFRALQKPGRTTVQGLWAELALLVWSANPRDSILAWHSNTHELFDFSNGSVRFEVKSTSKLYREHEFLLDQLATAESGETLVGSFVLVEDSGGDSITDLVGRLRTITTGMHDLHDRILGVVTMSLGTGWREAESLRFNLRSARENFRVFRADQIPSVSQPLPSGVTNVRFISKLDGVEDLPLIQAREMAALYAALLPEPSSNVTANY